MQIKELVKKVSIMCEIPLMDCGCTLWDVTFEKEGARYTLTVYIDNESGVDIEHCEKISRFIDPLLDTPEFDSLPEYVLSVSSAGLARTISKPEHYNWAMGKNVDITFYKAHDGAKAQTGILSAYSADTITVGGIEYAIKDVAHTHIHFDF